MAALCPRCELHPPRRLQGARTGRPSLCAACFHAAQLTHCRTYNARRKAANLAQRVRVLDDLPAAEIDRRFALALALIRRRTWTSDSSL